MHAATLNKVGAGASTSASTSMGSIPAQSKATFQVVDYIVFGVMLLVSAAVGVFFAIKERRSASAPDTVSSDTNVASNYLMAGRKMTYGPVAMSLIASFMSSVTILGVPAEFYIYGSMFGWYILPYAMLPLAIGWLYMPVFYDLRIDSAYEYLNQRFNQATKLIAIVLFMIFTLLYGGCVVYGPSLALSEVTGIDTWMAILSTGLVCIFYTTLGGLKAVIWTDVIQTIVMVCGFVAVIVQGSINLGGFDKIWNDSLEAGRINMLHFELDPRIRHTFWSIFFGGFFFWLGINGVNQTMVQRYVCCKSKQDARIAIVLNSIGLIVILILAGMTGLTIFAMYKDCDPLDDRRIAKADQLFPYAVMDILSYLPGIPGLFVAGVYSSSLSTISSAINAMACVTLQDFIAPNTRWRSSTYKKISQLLIIVYGLMLILIAYFASVIGGLIRMAYNLNSTIAGPLIGVFTLGMLMPFVNSWGAVTGTLSGIATTMWWLIGSSLHPPPVEFKNILPRSTKNCITDDLSYATRMDSCTQNPTSNLTSLNFAVAVATNATTTTVAPAVDINVPAESSPLLDFYSLSYCYVSPLGFCVTVIVGMVASACTGFTRKNPPADQLLFQCVRGTNQSKGGDRSTLERSTSWFQPSGLSPGATSVVNAEPPVQRNFYRTKSRSASQSSTVPRKVACPVAPSFYTAEIADRQEQMDKESVF